jgi:hypothetical protein
MSLDIRMPFFYGAAVAGVAILLVLATWGFPAVQKIVGPKKLDLEQGGVPIKLGQRGG